MTVLGIKERLKNAEYGKVTWSNGDIRFLLSEIENLAALAEATKQAEDYIDQLIEAATWSPPPLSLKVISKLVPIKSALTELEESSKADE